MEDCIDCQFGLQVGKIWICIIHKVQVQPIPNAHCEKWMDKDDDLHDNARMDLGKQENDPIIPRKE